MKTDEEQAVIDEEETQTATEEVVEDQTEVSQPESDEEISSDSETEKADESGEDQDASEEVEGVTIEIDGETPPQEQETDEFRGERAPDWVRKQRKENKELKRELRDLKKQISDSQSTKEEEFTLGPRPKLEEFDYDMDKFNAANDKWYADKRKADEQKAEKQAEAEKQKEYVRQVEESYTEKKTALSSMVDDYEDAEDAIKEGLSIAQQNVIISVAENPANIVYILYKRPELLKQMSAIEDPFKFAAELGKLENKARVKSSAKKGRPTTQPEGKVSSQSVVKGGINTQLARLEKEADKTGDRTKLIKFKRENDLITKR